VNLNDSTSWLWQDVATLLRKFAPKQRPFAAAPFLD
jgi:hypothetical protein